MGRLVTGDELLPAGSLPQGPHIDGYHIAAHMQPADEVGGDYYDVIHIGGLHWLVIGDVSGHGITAGLVMMMVQTAINQVLIGPVSESPETILTRVNQNIYRNYKGLQSVFKNGCRITTPASVTLISSCSL